MAIIAYTRVSTEEQTKGFGLDAQLDAIKAAVGQPGAHYTDEGLSGANINRPGLLAAIDALDKGDVLIVAKLDRLARDMYLSCWIEKEVEKHGATIRSAAGEGTESDDPTAKLLKNIVKSFAEFERDVIAARMAGGRTQARKQGRKMGGSTPFGFDLDIDGRHLVVNEAEQQVIGLMQQLRDLGYSYRQIGAELEQRGVKTKTGKLHWNPPVVKRALTQKNSAEAVRQRLVA